MDKVYLGAIDRYRKKFLNKKKFTIGVKKKTKLKEFGQITQIPNCPKCIY